ncbi:MAG: hypothetical protein ACLRU1_05885 [Veillonella parvula]
MESAIVILRRPIAAFIQKSREARGILENYCKLCNRPITAEVKLICTS